MWQRFAKKVDNILKKEEKVSHFTDLLNCVNGIRLCEKILLLLVIMPPSALHLIDRLKCENALFKVTNIKNLRITHASAFEFAGHEGIIYVPYLVS